MFTLSPQDHLLRDLTNDSPITRPLPNLTAANETTQSVLGKYSSRSIWVYQEVVPRVSEVFGDQLRKETDAMVKSAVRR